MDSGMSKPLGMGSKTRTTCRHHLQHNPRCVGCAGEAGDIVWGSNPTKYRLVERERDGWTVTRVVDNEPNWISDYQLTHFSLAETKPRPWRGVCPSCGAARDNCTCSATGESE